MPKWYDNIIILLYTIEILNLNCTSDSTSMMITTIYTTLNFPLLLYIIHTYLLAVCMPGRQREDETNWKLFLCILAVCQRDKEVYMKLQKFSLAVCQRHTERDLIILIRKTNN